MLRQSSCSILRLCRQHLVEKVLPELEKGNMVIMDRFIDSSVAYQGTGRGLNQDEIAWLNAYATDGYKPDVTLLFDVDSETVWPALQLAVNVKLTGWI